MMVRTTKKRPPMSPDPFLACVMGSGNETKAEEDERWVGLASCLARAKVRGSS